jgi:transcriptional regulator with XRE-family HTH domain
MQSSRRGPKIVNQAQRFDSSAFFKSLESTVTARGLTWKEVSQETGVSASTLSRMAQGRGPDAASLAILSAWSRLNPADFTNIRTEAVSAEPLALLTRRLRRDPNLSKEAAEALDEMIRATYERLVARKS